MASHRVEAPMPSQGNYPPCKQTNKTGKKNQAILHQAREQRLRGDNHLISVLDTKSQEKGSLEKPKTQMQISEDDSFFTTQMMRIVISGTKKGKKKGQRFLSFISLIGAFIVIGMYLVIPIMICLRLTDVILSALVAALILTLMEGIVGFILTKIGTAHKVTIPRKVKVSSRLATTSQPPAASSFIPVPTLLPVQPSSLPAFASTIEVPERNVVGMEGRQALPITDPIEQAAIAQAETLRVHTPQTATVPPFFKHPTSVFLQKE